MYTLLVGIEARAGKSGWRFLKFLRVEIPDFPVVAFLGLYLGIYLSQQITNTSACPIVKT